VPCPSRFAGRGHPLQQRDGVGIAESGPPETMTVTLLRVPASALGAADSGQVSDSGCEGMWVIVFTCPCFHICYYSSWRWVVREVRCHIVPCHLDCLCLILRTVSFEFMVRRWQSLWVTFVEILSCMYLKVIVAETSFFRMSL